MRVRGIDPALIAEISRPTFFPVLLLKLNWPSAPVLAHSSTGQIEFGGDVYNGVGEFGQIIVPAETANGASRRMSLILTGLPQEALDEINRPGLRGREGSVFFGALSETSGNILIGRPHEIYSGTIDVVSYDVSYDGENYDSAIQVDLVSGPPLRREASLFHTQEDHNLLFPNDTAGRHVQAAETDATNRRWPE